MICTTTAPAVTSAGYLGSSQIVLPPRTAMVSAAHPSARNQNSRSGWYKAAYSYHIGDDNHMNQPIHDGRTVDLSPVTTIWAFIFHGHIPNIWILSLLVLKAQSLADFPGSYIAILSESASQLLTTEDRLRNWNRRQTIDLEIVAGIPCANFLSQARRDARRDAGSNPKNQKFFSPLVVRAILMSK